MIFSYRGRSVSKYLGTFSGLIQIVIWRDVDSDDIMLNDSFLRETENFVGDHGHFKWVVEVGNWNNKEKQFDRGSISSYCMVLVARAVAHSGPETKRDVWRVFRYWKIIQTRFSILQDRTKGQKSNPVVG